MPLTKAKKRRVEKYFNRYVECLRCGNTEGYEVDPAYLPLEPPQAGGAEEAPKTLPVVLVACQTCRVIEFHSAKVRVSPADRSRPRSSEPVAKCKWPRSPLGRPAGPA